MEDYKKEKKRKKKKVGSGIISLGYLIGQTSFIYMRGGSAFGITVGGQPMF